MASKVYIINDSKWQFNFLIFNTIFRKHSISARQTLSNSEEKLAQSLHVTASAVHMWRNYKNAPGDIDIVKGIAAFYKISDYTLLLTPHKEDTKMANLSDRQLDSIKRIYDQAVKFLNDFYGSDGFKAQYTMYREDDKSDIDPESRLSEYLCILSDNTRCTYMQEYIFLHDTEIYKELGAFINSCIADFTNEILQVVCGYTEEEDGWADKAFSTAWNKLNGIVQKYV